MKIAILCSDFDENNETNGASLINNILINLGVTDISRFDMFKKEFPAVNEINSFNGVIMTGSRASIYNDKEWIKKFLELVKIITIPTLGICLGYQAVTTAFGGHVESSGKFEEGFKEILINDKDVQNSLLNNINQKFMVYESHGDIATELPKGANLISRNNFSNQMFEYKNFFCMQFHPEILPPTAIKMAERDNIDVDEILNGVNIKYDLTINIFKNFLNKISRFRR